MARRHTQGGGVDGYEPETKLGRMARIAHFLDWYAREHPYQFAPYNLVLKAIEGYAHTPRLASEDVQRVQRQISGASRILRKRYEREVIRRPGTGVRASVDDLDLVKNVQTRRVARLNSATQSLAATDEIIDVKNIANTPENRPFRQWYEKSVRSIIRELTDAKQLERLLPPKPEEEPES